MEWFEFRSFVGSRFVTYTRGLSNQSVSRLYTTHGSFNEKSQLASNSTGIN